MLTYEELMYLTAFAKEGTLSGVAQRFNISQPTITRCMKRIEDEFGVALFDRTKNSIKLNDNGALAADEAAVLLRGHEGMLRRVREYNRANHTVFIGTAAAVQLPDLMRRVTELFPSSAISTELKQPQELIDGLERGVYQLIILPFEAHNERFSSVKIGEEHLMFYLPKKHRFAKRKALSMAEMDGENMLLFSEIGFWHDITTSKMPHSRFLVQTERYSLEELVANSILPCFVTDLTLAAEPHPLDTRVSVPITDEEVNVSYYLVCKKENKRRFAALFR